ncbi:MAG: TIM barrel protein [Spirochaetes bacterium]|nr:TIM barrel protein [Spirochaetota bacterium]
MKIGVADYGMNVWYGGCYDTEERLRELKSIGYQGIERLEAVSEADAVNKAAMFRKNGMDFSMVRGPNVETTIRWTAALGKSYVWAQVTGKDFHTFCRQVNEQVRIAGKYGIFVGLHNHLGTLIETHEQLVSFLDHCPECGLVFDTGHHAAAGGDVMAIINDYHKRLVALHLKDWNDTTKTNPAGNPKWYDCGYFTGLGKGNIGQDNKTALKTAIAQGYDGWVFVEHDTHKQDPLIDLKQSRDYIGNIIGETK